MACIGAKQAAANNEDSVKGGKPGRQETTPENSTALNRKGRFPLSIHMTLGVSAAVYLVAGTCCFLILRDDIRGKSTNPLVDSLYYCVLTMTTVGYGDLYPHGRLVKIVTSLFAIAGMCLIGIVVRIATGFLLDRQTVMLVDALNACKKHGAVYALKQVEATEISYKKCLISLGVMLAHAIVGLFVLICVEEMDRSDATFCVSTTMTTIGYGDEVFSTAAGRFFGLFWITSGTSSVGNLLLYIAEVYTRSRMKSIIKSILLEKITSSTTDFDDEEIIGAGDFVLYKLKEMGKISEEDIVLAMKGADDPIGQSQF